LSKKKKKKNNYNSLKTSGVRFQVRQPGQRVGLAGQAADVQLSGERERVVAGVPVRPVLRLDHGHRAADRVRLGSQEPSHPGDVRRGRRPRVHRVRHVQPDQTRRRHHG